jgi:hypothetical protein
MLNVDWRSTSISNKKLILGTVFIVGILGATLCSIFLSMSTQNPENPEGPQPTFSLALFNIQNGSSFIFSPGDADHLAVNFTSGNLTEVRLYLNDVNVGEISPNIPLHVAYSAAIDGPVTLELRGFYNQVQVITECRNITFGKVVSSTLGSVIDTGNLSVPPQLYAIAHDPAGDQSESRLSASDVNYNIALLSSCENIGNPTVDFSLCTNLTPYIVPGLDPSPEFEWEYREPTLISESFTSCGEDEDPWYIGPGRGDTYFGCDWVLEWQLRNEQTHYFNSTDTSTLRLFYGLRMNGSYYVGDYIPAWIPQNPLNQPEIAINWTQKITLYSGYSQSGALPNVQLPVVNQSLTIETSSTARSAFPELNIPESIPICLKTNYNGTITSTFTMDDDDFTDYITCWVGKDPVYGTYIFSTIGSETQTTNPIEFVP